MIHVKLSVYIHVLHHAGIIAACCNSIGMLIYRGNSVWCTGGCPEDALSRDNETKRARISDRTALRLYCLCGVF